MDKYVMDIRLKQWIPILEAQARSGLDKQTFCKQNGISRGLFFKWQRILRERIADGFDPVSISAPAATTVSGINPEDGHPVFFEISPAPSTNLVNQDSITEATSKHMPIVDQASYNGHISISYSGFSISLSGEVDETSLTSILRAVKNA